MLQLLLKLKQHPEPHATTHDYTAACNSYMGWNQPLIAPALSAITICCPAAASLQLQLVLMISSLLR